MNKLNKILLTLSIVLAIAFCTILVLYLNLKSKNNKLEGEILSSQNEKSTFLMCFNVYC